MTVEPAAAGAAVGVPWPPYPREVPTLRADPGAVTGFGDRVLAASARVDELGSFAAAGAQVRDWRGDAAAAYHEVIRPLARRADTMSLALRHVGRRVLQHADVLAAATREHDDLLTDRRQLVDGLTAFRTEVRTAPAEQALELRDRAAWWAGRVRGFDQRVAQWQRALAEEERSVRDAFRAAGDLDRVERRWGGAGDPADAALASLPERGAGPGLVATWWHGLGEGAQLALLAAAPGAVGGLHGVPARARDRANRSVLAGDLAELGLLEDRGLLTRAEQRRLEHARATREALDIAADRLDPLTLEPVTTSLYRYDPGAFDGDGAVAVAYGDPGRAGHVSIHVSGLGTDLGSIVGHGDDAWAAYAASRSATADHVASVASVAWIGYDAPDNWGGPDFDAWRVAGEGLAREGGVRLAEALAGLDASRDTDAHVTVVGHSYGSTTAALGASGPGLQADDLVLVGSPGAGRDNDAHDLGVGARHVWVGTGSSDPVGLLGDDGWVGGLGTLGEDPSNADFGGRRFRAEDDQRTDGVDHSIDQHSSYYEQDSESLYNISQVITGQHDDVLLADERRDPWYWLVTDPEGARAVTRPSTGSWSP